jgi:hypothetical protein
MDKNCMDCTKDVSKEFLLEPFPELNQKSAYHLYLSLLSQEEPSIINVNNKEEKEEDDSSLDKKPAAMKTVKKSNKQNKDESDIKHIKDIDIISDEQYSNNNNLYDKVFSNMFLDNPVTYNDFTEIDKGIEKYQEVTGNQLIIKKVIKDQDFIFVVRILIVLFLLSLVQFGTPTI